MEAGPHNSPMRAFTSVQPMLRNRPRAGPGNLHIFEFAAFIFVLWLRMCIICKLRSDRHVTAAFLWRKGLPARVQCIICRTQCTQQCRSCRMPCLAMRTLARSQPQLSSSASSERTHALTHALLGMPCKNGTRTINHCVGRVRRAAHRMEVAGERRSVRTIS